MPSRYSALGMPHRPDSTPTPNRRVARPTEQSDMGPAHSELTGQHFAHAPTLGLLSHRMKVLRKRAGIEKLTLFTLRHSYCTRLILPDVNIRKVQELMGITT